VRDWTVVGLKKTGFFMVSYSGGLITSVGVLGRTTDLVEGAIVIVEDRGLDRGCATCWQVASLAVSRQLAHPPVTDDAR
jgi:hypothetical protein